MRNQELTRMRDKKLVERFFQLHDVQHCRLDDALAILSRDEFYLDSNYIYKLIFYHDDNHFYYESLKNAACGAKINMGETSDYVFFRRIL